MQTTTERPALSAGETARIFPPFIEHNQWGYDPAASAAQAGHPLVALIRLRQAAADEIERLLAFLDATESDLEDDGAEPTLEAIRNAGSWPPCLEDDEPSLGFTENHPECHDTGGGWWFPYRCAEGNQTACQGDANDREGEHDGGEPDCEDEGAQCEDEGAEHDGCEPDEDHEPSLGWTINGVVGAATSPIFEGELADGLMSRPKAPVTDPGITVEVSHRRFVHHMTEGQRQAFRNRLRPDAGVCVGAPRRSRGATSAP